MSLSTTQQAALLIRSLMRDLRVSDHVVYPGHKSGEDKPKAVVATVVLRNLDSMG